MIYKIGDLVYLRSGGPCMTVMNVDGGILTCIWFGDSNSLSTARILPECVDKWEEEKPEFKLEKRNGNS